MPTVYLAPDPINSTQLIPGGVIPASGGKLFQYLAGSSTKTDTYTDITGLVKWSNPIVLDSGGNLGGSNEVWIPAGVTVKFVLAPFNDTDPPIAPYKTWDNLSGINDPTSLLTEWVVGPTPTFVSTTSFTLIGDQTLIFTAGRRVKTTNTGGTLYGTISSSVFGIMTTVTIINDSGILDAGLSAVSYGILGSSHDSLPAILSETVVPPAGQVVAREYTITFSGNPSASSDIHGWVKTLSATGSTNISRIIGFRARALNDGAGTIADLRAQSNDSSIESSGNATDVIGYANRAGVTGTGSITNECANFSALVPTMTSTGTCAQMTGYTMKDLSHSNVTTVVGFQVPAMTSSPNIRAFQGSLAIGATRYNLYMDGTATNYLGGPLQLNAQLDVQTGDIVRSLVNAVAEISVNFTGFNGGTTQFRNFTIYDGKNNTIAGFTGSNKATTLNGQVLLNTDAPFVLTNQIATVGASTATLTNSPHNGNPTVWPRISINGTTFCFPCFPTT